MRKMVFGLCTLVFGTVGYCQTNTFPTSGSAGIGTTSPTNSLTFASGGTGAAFYNTADQVTNFERVVQAWNSNVFQVGYYYGGTGSQRSLQIGVTATANLTGLQRIFTISPNTSSTSGIFDFNTTTSDAYSIATFTGTLVSSTSLQHSVAIQPTINQSGTAGYTSLFIAPYLQATGSGSQLLIDAGTNTAAGGGGTHTPQFTVDHNGNGYFASGLSIGTNAGNVLTMKSTYGNCDVLFESINNYSWDLSTNQDGSFTFYQPSTGIAREYLDTSGHLCIGCTNSQGYLLAVNGPAVFTKAVVKLNANWPDYVFDPSYKLSSIKSIETFIKENRHLPGVPSSEEIEKSGVDLGNGQSVLLKKVEELTLYIIQQNKKNEEQDKVIAQQQALLLQLQHQLAQLKGQLKK